MKVAVTGHTEGLGLALAEALRASGHEVLGLPRPTDDAAQREGLLELAADCELFFNNRPDGRGEAQLQLLYRLTDRWRGQEKTIVNLGSADTDGGLGPGLEPGAIYQRALDAACQQLFSRPDQRPRVINLRPGPIAGEPLGSGAEPALRADDVVRVVEWILAQPPHVYVASVTVGARARS